MNIALIGATGTIGQRILKEALDRGHQVTAIVRTPAKVTVSHPNLTVVTGDIFKADGLASLVKGHDILVSAYGPPGDPGALADLTRTLIEAVKISGIDRLLAVGGAGSLEVAPGVQIVDTPGFPEAWKPIALAHRNALGILRESDINWTSFSPAGVIEPGERTGKFRLGTEQLVTDENGNSKISAEDYAIALLDEVENPQHIRARFTAAY